MGMSRATLEQSLSDGYQSAGQSDFLLTVSATDMPAALMILKKLKVANRISDYKRREAQLAEGRDDCVNIYGYTPPEE